MTTARIHYDASESLHGYKAWRQSLTALPIGTRIVWNVPYVGLTVADNINVGQCFMAVALKDGLSSRPSNLVADKVYTMILCTPKTGRLFKRRIYWSVEGIARMIAKNEVTIIDDSKEEVQ